MPFTPFHFGPGALVKSVAPKKFNLSTFVVSQVFIDIETLKNMMAGKAVLHTFFHTYLGSTVACAIVTVGMVIFYRIRNRFHTLPKPHSPTTYAILISALIGCWSHVFLDSIMHSDLEPWWPFSYSNSMLGLVSVKTLHLSCFLSGVVGGAFLLIEKTDLLKNHSDD
jgi:membrane-bound metal-dependent hydrolase YbcI (DUF457 family)